MEGTAEYPTLNVGMVLRSVGWAGVPLVGVPFDERERTIAQEHGRVLDEERCIVLGDYVAGWLKPGATGVIGTNRSDAVGTVRSLPTDAEGLRAALPDPVELTEALAARGLSAGDCGDWLRIDRTEAEHATDLGRGEWVELEAWEDYREALGGD